MIDSMFEVDARAVAAIFESVFDVAVPTCILSKAANLGTLVSRA